MASNVFNRESEVIETLPDRPHQPKSYSFPKKTFGKSRTVEHSCNSSWFQTWTWLHYNEAKDSLHCHTCCLAVKVKHIAIKPGATDAAFVSENIIHSYIFLSYL